MGAPPSNPRRRISWLPPEIHERFKRREDGAVYSVQNIYRHDRQVQLVPEGEGRPVYVFAGELDREWVRA